MIHIALGGIISMLYDAGIAEDYGVRGNVNVYITVGSNQNVITDSYVADDCGIDAYPDSISYRRGSFVGTSIGLSDGDTFVYIAIPTYASFSINSDIIGMS